MTMQIIPLRFSQQIMAVELYMSPFRFCITSTLFSGILTGTNSVTYIDD